MALITSAATGNFNSTSTWTGGVVPAAADEARVSNGHIVTITSNVTCSELSNAGTGYFVLNSGVTLTSNVTSKSTTANINCLTFSAASPATAAIVGNVTGGTGNPSNAVANLGTGTLSITGIVTGGGAGNAHGVLNQSSGAVVIVGNCLATNGNASFAVNSIGGGSVTITGNVTGGSNPNNSTAVNISTISASVSVTGNIFGGSASLNSALINSTTGSTTIFGNVTSNFVAGVTNSSSGALTISGGIYTATNGVPAIVSTNASATNRFSGTFVSSTNGTQPINATRWILNSAPTNSYIQQALDGINANSFVRFYTADNALGQANPTDVRSGVSYASGNLTGRLTVPARGSVALSVNYGPSMQFTATRSGTTATATLAYSYPLVVGDEFTVTGASNSEWTSTYTIASVVSGTSVTFTVPNTHSATAGTGALMQTTGTAVLDPTAVASAVWGAASRTITGGLVDTATTLTNAPTVPTPSQIASQVRTELTSELSNLDASVSSRLAGSAYTAPANSDISAIKAKTDNLPASPAAVSDIPTADIAAIKSSTDNLPSDPADQSLVEAAISALSIPSVVEIRTEMDSNSTKLANLDATVSSRLAGSVYTAPTSAPSASAVATAVRTELGTELGRIDQSISSRLASADYTTPPTTAQISAAVEGSLLNEADGQQVLNALVGAIGNQNVDEIALVAAIRSDLERSGGKLDSIPTAAAPSAASVASAVWSASTKEITGGVVDTLTNSPDVPTEAEIASQVRTELSVELGRIDAAISSRLAPSGTLATVTTLTNAPTVPTAAAIADEVRVELATELARLDAPVSGATAPSAATVASQVRTELTAELAKVSALNTERLANVATTAIVGNLIAQANS